MESGLSIQKINTHRINEDSPGLVQEGKVLMLENSLKEGTAAPN